MMVSPPLPYNSPKAQYSTNPPVVHKDHNDGNKKKDAKKSRVAALASKFSLKDLAKEYRKGGPAENMPSLPTGSEASRALSEEKLYMPQPKRSAIEPQSAPACNPAKEFDRSLPLGGDPQSAMFSSRTCSGLMQSGIQVGPGAQGNERFLSDTSEGTDSLYSEEKSRFNDNSELSSHNELSQMGAPGPSIVTGQRTETNPNLTFKFPADNSSQSFVDAVSNIQAPKPANAWFPNNGSHRSGEDEDSRHYELSDPFVVSSNMDSDSPLIKEKRERFGFVPTAPAFDPAAPRPYSKPFHSAAPAMAGIPGHPGMTTQGDYGPPPFNPNTRDGASFEYQLSSHVDSLHHHLGTVVNRLHKALIETHNLSSSQLVTRCDAMLDLCNLLNSRIMSQSDALRQVQGKVGELQRQLDSLRQEDWQMEQRLAEKVKREVVKVKSEITKISRSNLGAVCTGSLATVTRVTADNDMNVNTIDESKGAEPDEKTKPNKLPISRSSTSLHRRAGQMTVGNDTVPTPTAAFRTPTGPEEERNSTDDAQSRGRQRRSLLNPAVESSGSPTPRPARLEARADLRVEPPESMLTISKGPSSLKSISQCSMRERTNGGRNKKGVWSFRKRKAEAPHEKDSHSECYSDASAFSTSSLTPPIPPVPLVPGIPGASENTSPSNIHPALRTQEQQRIMRAREIQRNIDQNQILPRPATPLLAHRVNPLMPSHHEQPLGYRQMTMYSQPAGNPLYPVLQHPSHLSPDSSVHAVSVFDTPPSAFHLSGAMPPHTSSPGAFGPAPRTPFPFTMQPPFNVSEPDPLHLPPPWLSHLHTHPVFAGHIPRPAQANQAGDDAERGESEDKK